MRSPVGSCCHPGNADAYTLRQSPGNRRDIAIAVSDLESLRVAPFELERHPIARSSVDLYLPLLLVRAPLRASLADDVIAEAIRRKPKGHGFIIDRRHTDPAVAWHMSVTGAPTLTQLMACRGLPGLPGQ